MSIINIKDMHESADLHNNIITKLRFDDVEEYRTFYDKTDHAIRQLWLWSMELGNAPGTQSQPGICDICQKNVRFESRAQRHTDSTYFEFEIKWLGEAQCSACGMTTFERAALHALKDVAPAGSLVYHVGHYSRLAKRTREYCETITSQFESGRQPGEIHDGVRYEDLTRLSFANAQFDAVLHSEVLEHIPYYQKALSECFRVLKLGGRLIMTFPWRGRDDYEHFTRAELLPDGLIKYLCEPEYHGDPASTEGILSFRVFGWKILDELRAVGFRNAYAQFLFSPLHGYIPLAAPVVVGVK